MDSTKANIPVLVNVRVEAGNNITVFEGSAVTYGHTVTADTGGTHLCDGTNGNENPFPCPTCTSALDDASRPTLRGQNTDTLQRPFTWDGEYDHDLDDFLVTRIGAFAATDETFWSLWHNFKFADVGGGQLQIREGDSVLWALIPIQNDPTKRSIPLKLKGPRAAHTNDAFTVSIIDGSNRLPVAGAEVMGVRTDEEGKATLILHEVGVYRLKATKGDDIASNVLEVLVT